MTTWYNPTDVAVKFKIFEAHGKDKEPACWTSIEVLSKGKIDLDAKYDDAIRKVLGGQTVGLAPQLLKGDEIPAEPIVKESKK